MKAGKRRWLLIAGGTVLLVITLILIVPPFLDVNRYRPQIEEAASGVLGMSVSIKGPMRLSLLPSARITISDLVLKNRDLDLAAAKELRVGLRLLPLLRKEVQIESLSLIKPAVRIEQDREGRFNFESAAGAKKETGRRALPRKFTISKLAVEEATLLYEDRKTAARVVLTGLDADLRDISMVGASGQGLARSIACSGDIRWKELTMNRLRLKDARLAMRAGGGRIELKPAVINLTNRSEQASLVLDMTKEEPRLSVSYSATQFPVEQLLASLSQRQFMRGKMDFSLELSAVGRGPEKMKKSVEGTLLLKGDNLTMSGVDIDRLLSTVEKGGSLTVVDLGSVLFAGPLGALITKGGDALDLYAEGTAGGETRIKRFVSKWKVKNSIAGAEDVAFSTQRHRIAVKGRLNLPGQTYDNITVAVINEKGCATLTQKIEGTFSNPRIERTSTAASVLKSVLGFFAKTGDMVSASGCEVYYSGSVSHPR